MSGEPVRVGLVGYGLAGAVFHAPFLAADPDLRLDVVVTDASAPSEELSRLAGCGVLDVEITVSALLPAAQRDRVE